VGQPARHFGGQAFPRVLVNHIEDAE